MKGGIKGAIIYLLAVFCLIVLLTWYQAVKDEMPKESIATEETLPNAGLYVEESIFTRGPILTITHEGQILLNGEPLEQLPDEEVHKSILLLIDYAVIRKHAMEQQIELLQTELEKCLREKGKKRN